MDKKIAGLLGAAAALATVGGAHAAVSEANAVDPGLTYRDLLSPVPNATEALKADDAQRESGQTKTEVAQITIGVGHLTIIITTIITREHAYASFPRSATIITITITTISYYSR